jgi:nucleotide-binding universal stress UspA family protein
MFSKILVAINNTENYRYVFEQALSLALATNAQLLLFHVISPFDDDYSNDVSTKQKDNMYVTSHTRGVKYYVNQWEALKQSGMEFLTSLSHEAIAQGVKVDFAQKLGDPGRLICEIAHTWNADLIIVGRRGVSRVSEFFMGSVSNYVLHHAPCSVLTIQGTPSTRDKVKVETLRAVSADLN